MSVKIKLELDTIPDKSMCGYVSNYDAYRLRNLIYDAIVEYENPNTREEWYEIASRFYNDISACSIANKQSASRDTESK